MLRLAVVFLLIAVLACAVLPTVIESRLAGNLKERYGLAEGPVVEVSSEFPPELLLGRADQVEVWIYSFTKEGIRLRNLHVDMEHVDVSVPGHLQGDWEREIRSGYLTAEVPEGSINQYLLENELGLEDGEVDVRPGNVFYRSADAFFGLPASINLDLRVASPGTVEVIPEGATVGGFPLPPFLTKSLASGGRTLTVGNLPLGAELVSVEAQNDALMIRAERWQMTEQKNSVLRATLLVAGTSTALLGCGVGDQAAAERSSENGIVARVDVPLRAPAWAEDEGVVIALQEDGGRLVRLDTGESFDGTGTFP